MGSRMECPTSLVKIAGSSHSPTASTASSRFPNNTLEGRACMATIIKGSSLLSTRRSNNNTLLTSSSSGSDWSDITYLMMITES